MTTFAASRLLFRAAAVSVTFAATAALSPAAAAETPVRVALVSNLDDAATQDGLALSEATLTANRDIALLERKRMLPILAEHKFAFAGMMDAATAIKAGKLLSVELLAVVAGDPAAKRREVVSLVVFDARTGVRLADCAFTADPKKMAWGVGETVAASAAKHRLGRKATKNISVVSIRNVDLPAARGSWCQAIGRLLERDLCASPQVAVLERSYLEHVTRERAIAADAPLDDLLASMLRLDLEFSLTAKDRVAATAYISGRRGPKRKVSIEVSPADATFRERLLTAVLKELDATKPTVAFDRTKEARALMDEADCEQRQDRFDRAAMLVEAALALAPNEPSLWPDATRQFLIQAMALFDIDDTVPWSASRWHSRKPRCSPEAYEAALSYLLRGVEICVMRRDFEAKSGPGVQIRRLPQDPESYCGEDALDELICEMHNYRDKRTAAAAETARTILDEYRRLHLRLLFPAMLAKYGTPQFDGELSNRLASRLSHMFVLAADTDEFLKLHCESVRSLLGQLDKKGPSFIPHTCEYQAAYNSSYVNLLWGVVPHQIRSLPYDDSPCTEEKFRPLKSLFDSMMRHRLPGVQILGRGGHLWLDVRFGRVSRERLSERFQDIVAFAKRKIADPGVENEDAERLACYEAVYESYADLRELDPRVWDPHDQMWELMLSRNEVMLPVIFAINHKALAGFSTNEQPPVEGKWFFGPLRPERTPLTREQTAACVDAVRTVLATKAVRIPDGNLAMILAALNHMATKDVAAVKRWTNARKLLEVEKPDSRNRPVILGQPVVVGEDAYLITYAIDGNERVWQLVCIHLPDGKMTKYGKISRPWSGPCQSKCESIEFDRWCNPVGKPELHEGRLYCPASVYGGIFVFPLDNSEPSALTPATSPGMATGVIDAIAVQDGGLLALSSSSRATSSYILWHDFKTKQWETIAAGNRVHKKTLLDYDEAYLRDLVPDPARHRIFFSLRQTRPPGEVHSGLYAFDTRTHKIEKLFAFPYNGPVYMQAVGRDRVWVHFPNFGYQMDRVFEFDMRTEQWRLVMSNTGLECEVDAKPFDSAGNPVRGIHGSVIPKGLRLDEPRYGGPHIVFPPQVVIDGWLWCFKPFCRISANGKRTEMLAPLEQAPKPNADYFHCPGEPNTLMFFPKQRWVLYGSRHVLWLLELPPPEIGIRDEAGGSPHKPNGRETTRKEAAIVVWAGPDDPQRA